MGALLFDIGTSPKSVLICFWEGPSKLGKAIAHRKLNREAKMLTRLRELSMIKSIYCTRK